MFIPNKMACYNSKEEIEAEQSLQTAALLSLAGVSCLLSRQWSSPVDSCTDTVCNFLKSTPVQFAAVHYDLCYCFLPLELLSGGVGGVADMKWSETREQSQLVTDSDTQEMPNEPSKEQKDHSSVFNSVVYGLPHLALTLPTQ